MNKNSEQYKNGFDCGLYGANKGNSHFSNFATKESTADWEAGVRDGNKAKANNAGKIKKPNPRKK